MVIGFEDLLSAISAVPAILKFSPVALEMLDHTVVGSDDSNMHGAGCLLIIEFAGNRSINKVEERMRGCKQELADRCSQQHHEAYFGESKTYWPNRGHGGSP
jgi:hypothetical protein